MRFRTVARYGWRPDLPDHRDCMFSVVHPSNLPVPDSIDLAPSCPPVFDQGQLGSCTANALACAFGFIHSGFIASRLEIYYEERQIEGDVGTDGGAQIRDGVKVLNTIGAAPETDWPYIESRFARKPTTKTIHDAGAHKVSKYSRLTGRTDFLQCLAAGFPFVIGFTVYEAFEGDAVAANGVVSMPSHGEQVMGGHAICVIGREANYKGLGDHYKVRNSWGTSWGDGGNFWMPAAYFETPSLANDAWTLRL